MTQEDKTTHEKPGDQQARYAEFVALLARHDQSIRRFHRYNALFMGDGYENGEPHWQIRNDGKLMFSVMVDDTQEVRFYNKTDQRVVRDAGLHRIYYTKPFWDISKSGQWFHLVAVCELVPQKLVIGAAFSQDAVVRCPQLKWHDRRIGDL